MEISAAGLFRINQFITGRLKKNLMNNTKELGLPGVLTPIILLVDIITIKIL